MQILANKYSRHIKSYSFHIICQFRTVHLTFRVASRSLHLHTANVEDIRISPHALAVQTESSGTLRVPLVGAGGFTAWPPFLDFPVVKFSSAQFLPTPKNLSKSKYCQFQPTSPCMTKQPLEQSAEHQQPPRISDCRYPLQGM